MVTATSNGGYKREEFAPWGLAFGHIFINNKLSWGYTGYSSPWLALLSLDGQRCSALALTHISDPPSKSSGASQFPTTVTHF